VPCSHFSLPSLSFLTLLLLSYTLRTPPSSPLFPYTTLFRSPSPSCGTTAPSCARGSCSCSPAETAVEPVEAQGAGIDRLDGGLRSEEHTSELQSLTNLVCRPLLDITNN